MAEDIASFLRLRDELASPIEAPIASDEVKTWDIECDVLVVGFGLAGASAAIEAADRGLDVLLIDRFQGGGSSEMSGGVVYAGGGTPVQQACGIEDTPAAMADYLRREVAGTVADETVQRFCDDSIDTLAFLTRNGVQFSGPAAPKKTSYPPSQYYLYYSDNGRVPAYISEHPPAPRGHRSKDAALVPGARRPPGKKPHGGFSEGADMGWHLMAALKLAIADRPNIRVLTQARADRLMTDSSGRIVGAKVFAIPGDGLAARFHAWAESKAKRAAWELLGAARPLVRWIRRIERKHGQPILVHARRGVVLSAGGHRRNTAIMRRYAALHYLDTIPLGGLGDDGAGLRLGMSVGAAADYLDKISAWRFVNPPYEWTKGVIVGRDGRRITNEEQYGAHVTRDIFEKSGGKAWLIVDKQTWDNALAEVSSGELYAFQKFPVNQARKKAARAETLDALAVKIGVPAESMKADIAAYSSAASDGLRDPMGKSEELCRSFGAGPYFAIALAHQPPTNPITALTTGGLRVDEATGAVLTAQGIAIPALFAAGRTAAGIPSNNYVSGLSLADCVWSGRRAARTIAEGNSEQ